MPAAPADPLRPALEVAFEVARAGAAQEPPIPAPGPLRPLLRFTKVTPRVLDEVRRVVEGDEGFRSRVARAADEDEVGRAGSLWLLRPDGWREELAGLVAAHEAAAHDAAGNDAAADDASTHDGQAPSRSERRLQRERRARRRAEDELREERSGAEALRGALADEQAARDEVERALSAALSTKLRLEDDRSEAIRLLKLVEARAAEVAAERNELRRKLRDHDDATSSVADVPDRPPSDGAGQGPALDNAPDWAAVAATMGDAAADAAGLSRSLAAVAATFGIEPDRPRPPGPARPSHATAQSGAVPPRAASPGPRQQRSSRVPVGLPGGVLDDGPDAAEHLMRVRGAVLLIDGYNVTKSVWPELSAAEQRARLVQALGTLTARTGIAIDVVFDGADVVPTTPLLSPRGVRVRYSSPDVEADDVILELVREYPSTRPVIVASSDRRVRDGARQGGANLLHARQLVAAIRR